MNKRKRYRKRRMTKAFKRGNIPQGGFPPLHMVDTLRAEISRERDRLQSEIDGCRLAISHLQDQINGSNHHE